MTNPDEIPVWIGIPLAIFFWGIVIVGMLRELRARKRQHKIVWHYDPNTGKTYPVLERRKRNSEQNRTNHQKSR